MPDEIDDLILKMQHLEASVRAQRQSGLREGWAASLKSRAQKMAAEAHEEISAAEHDEGEGAAKVAQAKTPGLAPLQAADLLAGGRQQMVDAKVRLVKARARLKFALDQMDEAERVEFEALRKSALADAHAQLADSGADSSRAPEAPAGAGTGGGGGGGGAAP